MMTKTVGLMMDKLVDTFVVFCCLNIYFVTSGGHDISINLDVACVWMCAFQGKHTHKIKEKKVVM